MGIINPSGGGGGTTFTYWKGLLNVGGGNTPQGNTLGGAIVWAISAAGIWTGTKAGAFPVGKTLASARIATPDLSQPDPFCAQAYVQDVNTIVVQLFGIDTANPVLMDMTSTAVCEVYIQVNQ